MPSERSEAGDIIAVSQVCHRVRAAAIHQTKFTGESASGNLMKGVATFAAGDADDRSGRMKRSGRMLLLGVLLTAFAARAGVLWTFADHLSDDRDAYIALAQGLAAGRGFSVPGSDRPTAFRPPLYPLLLAVTGASHSIAVRGLLHLVLGTGTVWLTYILGRRLQLTTGRAALAAALVAVDPLLLWYTTFPMTETLVTFLTTALLLVIASPAGLRRQLMIGLLFGLGVLSRPTLWAFGGLMALHWLVLRWNNPAGNAGQSDSASPAESDLRRRLVGWWVTPVIVLLTVSPWVVRNGLVMGHPILMTTHGGYTLLLGNNPAFYREVVEQPGGTVWDGSVGGGQAAWAESLNREMAEAGITGEVARDRWMSRRARANILAEPGLFLKACSLRLRRFWGVVPLGADAAVVPGLLRIALAMFYCAVSVVALIGLVRAVRFDWKIWLPAILLVAAFVGVHLVYWSNARMRAPVVPVVALLAARGLVRDAKPARKSA